MVFSIGSTLKAVHNVDINAERPRQHPIHTLLAGCKPRPVLPRNVRIQPAS
ncbi:MAG: hypothetical protein ACLRYB_18135 [Segatella copri]